MTRLSLAIPSKGRLKEASENWLQASGFKLRQLGGGRGYRAELKGLPDADIMLLSASEIASGLIEGQLHVGVTGQDLMHEASSDFDRDIHVMKPLGFGGADVIVAVPQSWLDVDTMADLEAAGAQFRATHGRRMRVATKYLKLTRRFFAQRSVGEYRLVESAGATEAAPAAGTAEVIVDITSTGATLKANGLKILSDGVILQSEAVFAASRKANWSDAVLQTLRVLIDGVEANQAGEGNRRLECGKAIPDAIAKEMGLTQFENGTLLCPASDANRAARALALNGFGPVIVSTVDRVYNSDSAIFSGLVKNLS